MPDGPVLCQPPRRSRRSSTVEWGATALLILGQKPESIRVASYRTWQSLGRQVKRGEKAIRIIAPAYYKKKERDVQTGEDVERQVTFFRGASVFDISQTDGAPLPEVAVPVLDSDTGAELYARLEGVALTEGLRVTIGHESFMQRATMDLPRNNHLTCEAILQGVEVPHSGTVIP
jgi:antirestriction protein ArdC